MPTEKRSKEQTWKEEELKQSLREVNGERSHGKSRGDKYGDERKVSKESSHRDRNRDREGEERHERRKDKPDSDRKRSDRDEWSKANPNRHDSDSRRHRDDKERTHRSHGDERDDGRRNNRSHGHKEDDREPRHYSEKDRDRHNRGDSEHDELRNERRSHRVDDRGQGKKEDGGRRSHRGEDRDRDRDYRDNDRGKSHKGEDRDHRDRGHRREHQDRDRRGEERDREHRSNRGGENDRERRDKRHEREDEEKGHRREDRDRGHRREDRDREHKSHKGGEKDREHRERRHEREDEEKRHKKENRERGHREEDKDKSYKDSDRDRGHRREKNHDDKDRERRNRGQEREPHHGDDERTHKRKDEHRKRREHSDSMERGQTIPDRISKDKNYRDGDRKESSKHDRDDQRKDRHGDRRHRSYYDDDGERHKDVGDQSAKHRDRNDPERRKKDTDKDRQHRSDRHRDDHHDKRDDERHQRHESDRKKERRHRDDASNERTQEQAQKGKHKSDEISYNHEDESSKGSQKDRAKSGHSRKRTSNLQKDDVEEEIAYNPRAEATAQDEDDYGGYDDDFEDYDDDFEDDDGDQDDSMAERVNKMSNSEMEALYDALNAENEKLLADSRSNLSDSPESPDERYTSRKAASSKPRGFINFVAAKQRDMNQKVASKARKRCSELLNIIELDTVHMSLFDLPPVKEYDLYMSSFGRTNAQQACVQTNEDNLERDIQTEDIEYASKWTQCPSEGAAACGSADENADSNESASKHDDGKLAAFLQRTCQVIERLLYEEDTKSLYKDTSSEFSCSEASFSLVDVEVFRCRQVSRCHFSPTDSTIILTMHTDPLQAVDKKLDKYGMIGVWNTNDPSAPQKIVASASMPSCCCFSPIKATLVFGGMQDGSLVAWDLREPPTMHHSYMCGKTDWLLRFPTYNTAGVLKYDNHSSPITALVPILTDSSKSLSQESGLGLSFQLASLDKNGVVNLWVVAEILETSMAGSESDLGLSPNGKIKLLKSSTVTLHNPSKINDLSSLCTVDLKLNPSNHNHFYVGTDSGTILHGTRFGTQKVSPRCYASDDLTPCKVNSIDLHPFGHPLMLAGCEDGSLKLYHLSSESPIIVWENSTGGAAIRRVLWSKNCSYILFVLDANSTIHMWDLLRNDAEPMTSDSMARNNLGVADVCLSEEHVHSRPKMVVSYSNGTVQVHLLSGHVSNLQPGENDQFTRFIDNL